MMATKKNFFAEYVVFEAAFTSFFKVKKVIKKSQNSRNQGFFLLVLLDDRRIRMAQKHPDPDPRRTR